MPEQTELTAAAAAPGLGLAAPRTFRAVAEPLLVGLGGLLLTSAVAAADGGYFSDSWAWLALVSLCVATLRLILVPAVPLRRLDWAFVGGLGAFAGWVALSALWAPAATPALDETIRDAAYASVVLALLLVVRRKTVEPLLVGALAGVTLISAYSLLTRLQPDRVGDWNPATLFRLAGPIGYWNGLGVYAAMGTLLALGLVARSGSRVVQAPAAVAPVLLLPTMLFTFSRGAWLALAVGLAAVFLVDARRLQLLATALVLAPWPAVAMLVATRSDHLTKSSVTLLQAGDEGGALLGWIAVLAVAAACAALAFRIVSDRIQVSDGVRTAIGAASLFLAAVAAIVAFSVYGAPWTLADRAYDRFSAPPTASGADVTDRLFDLSSNGRIEQWRVSVDQFREHPLAGEGAGTYAAAWNLRRPSAWAVQDSHSLYVEVLGELGAVGLALIVLAAAVPLVAAIRARRRPLVAGAFAAYAAFLAHAAVDWDWELAGVTLVALVAAAALVVSARGGDRELVPRSVAARVALPAVTAALALLALAAVLSTVPLANAREAYNRLDFQEAAAQAKKASDWAPWSSEALDLLGRAQLGQGQVAKARTSFRQAVAKSPNDWELWRDLAAASPPVQGRAAVRRALALNPLETELKQLQQTLAKSR